MTRITSKKATTAAIRQLCSAFREHGTRCRQTLGYQGGHESKSLDIVDAVDVWFAHSQEQWHWCAFGTVPLPTGGGSVKITVEINPPIEGINRRLAGLLAADGAGTLYLCHTGRVGGGKKGISKKNFLEWCSRKLVSVVDPDGQSTLAFPVAQIGSVRMVDHIAEYVWEVRDFKDHKPARIKTLPKGPFGGSGREFEGSKRVRGRSAYTATCDHGIVCNRLSELIRATGRTVSRDQQRDLLVGEPGTLEVEFEIKTSTDSQSVYTAVGQLLMHDAAIPVKRRVAVLPSPPDKTRQRAFKKLDIDIVTYRWTKTQIRFTGLDKIIPGTGNIAPISTRK